MWQKLISPAVDSPLDFFCIFLEHDLRGRIKQIYTVSNISDMENTEKFLVRNKKAKFLIDIYVHQYYAKALLETYKDKVVSKPQ